MTPSLILPPRVIPGGDVYLIEMRGDEMHVDTRVTVAEHGRRFDRAAILEALDMLEVIYPVQVKLTVGVGRAGAHRWDRDRDMHVITLSHKFEAEQMSRNLWHELTHSAQCDRSDPKIYHRAYRTEQQIFGYRLNRFEREARQNEAWHDACPLVLA